MLNPVELFVGLRYLRAKRRTRFVSFITLISLLGIALGVAVLITVLSVMNGFDYQIKTRLFGMAQHVTIDAYGGIHDWAKWAQQADAVPGVLASAPFVGGQGMLTNNGIVHTAYVVGVAPKAEANVTILASKMQQGQLSDLVPGKYGVIIGARLADALGATLGSHIILVTPQANNSIIGMMPIYRQLKVVGIFSVGNGFGFDDQFAFINIQDAQKIYRLGDRVTGIRLKLKDLYAAPALSKVIQQRLPDDFSVSNWTEQYAGLFSAISLEKTMISLLLTLIIAVAAFNMVSSLVMLVTDKSADIAILRTFGATPRLIMTIFIIQGVIVGSVGVLLGLIAGVTLALNVTDLFYFIEHVFHVQLMASNIYYVNYLPSRLQYSDVLWVCSVALLMSVLATLYPAWRASRIEPAEALRYD